MHNHNEDQPSISLPNLSEWHRVPTGATIPAYVPYAYTYGSGSVVIELDGYSVAIELDDDSGITYYTEQPIAPPLPTEEGATILVTSQPRLPPNILLTREDGIWVNCYGAEWSVQDIHSWAPVTIGEVVHKS